MGRTVRNRPRLAAWMTSLLSLILALATLLWLAVPAVPSTAGLSALAMPLPFSGIPTVGALFTVRNGRPGSHFCTASVVNSPAGDVIVTAAHCVAGYSRSSPDIAFVPGYDDGAAPAGVWPVTHILVDAKWAANANPDDDFAFLTVAQSGHTSLQSVTGADSLSFSDPPTGIVRVIGYPDAQNGPIVCQNLTTMFSATQTQFNCDGFTVGTSGSPLVVGAGGSGQGTLVGVIGGYEQGGDSADVSYAAAFGQNAQALYDLAAAQT
jgi:V8-like Glu-specific endopeptidase